MILNFKYSFCNDVEIRNFLCMKFESRSMTFLGMEDEDEGELESHNVSLNKSNSTHYLTYYIIIIHF